MAMIYVSHDLGVIARVCEKVMVMYAGEAVLQGPTADGSERPRASLCTGAFGVHPAPV